MRALGRAAGVVLILLTIGLPLRAQVPQGGIGVDEHLGATLPLDLTFRDGGGGRVALRDLLGQHAPTILVLAYYRCPMLCDRVVGGLVEPLRTVRLATGTDYRVAVISFDPHDTPADASQKQRTLLAPLNAFERAHWRFAVDQDGSAARLADRVGFRYWFDRSSGQFAHPAVVFAISPAGKVTRYLYGVTFTATDLASALDDASVGRTRSTVERILLRCFEFLPALQRHATAVSWILRGGTIGMFVLMAGLLVHLVRRGHARGAA